jgi:RNA polymerase sigma factor (sigma-70 family)
MISYTTLTDKELTDLLNQQDELAYEAIYRRYWSAVYDFARKSARDEDDAKDIVQEIFASIYANIGKKDFSKIEIKPYLYQAVRYKTIDLFKKGLGKVSLTDSLAEYLNTYQTDSAEQTLIEKETVAMLEDEISRLPRKMREIFELARDRSLSRREIADITNLSEENVKKQIYNARKTLWKKLSKHFCFYLMIIIILIGRAL